VDGQGPQAAPTEPLTKSHPRGRLRFARATGRCAQNRTAGLIDHLRLQLSRKYALPEQMANFTMDDDHFGLIPRPDGQLVGKPLDQLPAIRRVTSEVLAHAQRLPVEQKRVRIAGFELRAPDAELITTWASAIQISPDDLLEHLAKTRLIAERTKYPSGLDVEVVEFEIADGELRSLVWDLDRFPEFPDQWVPGLKLQKFGLYTSKGVTEITLTPITPDLSELWLWGLSRVSVGGLPRLATMSLGGATRLRRIMCSAFDIKELDLSPTPGLIELNCEECNLDAIDLSCTNELQQLDCSENRLKELDLSPVPGLQKLWCPWNEIAELDLSFVPGLKVLDCLDNRLTRLDLSLVTGLEELNCSDNRLAEINLSPVTRMTTLCCWGNQLAKLDLSPVTGLKKLHCNENQLTVLDLAPVTELEELDCGRNLLTELDLSSVTRLQELGCSGNLLVELDLSPVNRLKELSCSDNQLTELSLLAVPGLQKVWCDSNKIRILDLPSTLTFLWCDRSVVLHNEPQKLFVRRR
jgi:Leucine-rich repeat (LRR) protein